VVVFCRGESASQNGSGKCRVGFSLPNQECRVGIHIGGRVGFKIRGSENATADYADLRITVNSL